MNYAYIRVSTDKQNLDNQRQEINRFCLKNNITIDAWFSETISGTKALKDRRLGKLLKKMKKGDILVCSELSRLGRTLFMIMDFLSECLNKDVKVYTVKENFMLGDNISSKVLAFAFGLSAEIERKLISERTKEGLARARQDGKVLGRPKGSKNKHVSSKFDNELIYKLRQQKMSIRQIALTIKVHPNTLYRYMKNNIYNLHND